MASFSFFPLLITSPTISATVGSRCIDPRGNEIQKQMKCFVLFIQMFGENEMTWGHFASLRQAVFRTRIPPGVNQLSLGSSRNYSSSTHSGKELSYSTREAKGQGNEMSS
ncbi:hypothetical protein CDAR_273521 [Caerostris darwini]|uniref:Secreted protein n=1 Tax=Caerostris darwini TaxID=1538125 RepID=A0AAV4W4N8_9ARAC|nr:hypothetical protein CDAR_273521 [Caerostris darwini]